MDNKEPNNLEEKPPFFGSWLGLYVFVAAFLLVQIGLYLGLTFWLQ